MNPRESKNLQVRHPSPFLPSPQPGLLCVVQPVPRHLQEWGLTAPSCLHTLMGLWAASAKALSHTSLQGPLNVLSSTLHHHWLCQPLDPFPWMEGHSKNKEQPCPHWAHALGTGTKEVKPSRISFILQGRCRGQKMVVPQLLFPALPPLCLVMTMGSLPRGKRAWLYPGC